MSHKIAYATPAAPVATGATVTFSYPDGTTAGDFAAYGHKMWSQGLQVMLSQDAGTMSVAFGASDITVTYKGSTSLPANKTLTAEFNIAGTSDKPADLVASKRISYLPVMRLDLGAPDTADPNGIVESQDLTALGVYSVLAFNGVYGDPYGNLHAVLDVPRNVVAAWTGAAILTVTGEDEYGDVVVESSPSGTSFTGKKAFKKITDVSVSANVTALTVGSADVLGIPVFVGGATFILAEIEDGVAAYPFFYDGDTTGNPVAVVHTLLGTFVAGVQTTPTATTGDVRGTYDPATAADGATSFSLVVMVPDPAYKGVDNYDG